MPSTAAERRRESIEHGSVKHQHRGRKNYAVRGRTPQEGLWPCLGPHPMMEPPHAREHPPGRPSRPPASCPRRPVHDRARARPRGDGNRLPRRGPEAPSKSRHQGPEARPRGRARAGAFSPRDRDRGRPEPSPYPASPRLRRRSEEHTSELQSRFDLVCRLLLEKKKTTSNKRFVNGRFHSGFVLIITVIVSNDWQ